MQFDETFLPPLPPLVDIGDGSFEYVNDMHERDMLQNAFKAINLAEAWHYVRSDPGEGGFMFSNNPIKYKIMEKMEQCEPCVGHSGSSYGFVMRNMQFLAKHGIQKHRESYIGDDEE
jgi:hypothetical protein